MSERVRIEMKDGVADVRLNRPEKMNALDDAMFRGIIDAGMRLKEDSSVRAVVLSGEGRAFCAGLDMSSFGAMAGDASASEASEGRAARGLLSKTGTLKVWWDESDSKEREEYDRLTDWELQALFTDERGLLVGVRSDRESNGEHK